MLLFSTALLKHQLDFAPLSECMEYLPAVAAWAENEWGYIRNKGVEYREQLLSSLKEHVYVGTFNGQPVALFALFPKEMASEFHEKKFKAPTVTELMYVYVDKTYRGLNFGKQVVEKAKEIAKSKEAEFIMLDTLKPSLNRFYQNSGAQIIAENQLFSHPTDVLTIKL
ncbi:GNAT family N-acetyltransferase [Legionella sp. PATHC035]|uniref:GNAT family N-acetyltransferase n=1 Tax=Legionella sp. PATHC035 TaxID=2992040 RepID=UPI0022438E55|nr:GNAT family N-acetyltransferase [Legionella sp. PATHC035]MCW8409874.1 GNAT family N-acetyltransferase [Legionella sp. PATHC035]